MSALERELAKSKLASRKSEDGDNARPPWPKEVWEQAWKAMDAGYKRPPIRFPILLLPAGPISSAAQLQHLIEADSLPESIETSQLDYHDKEIKKVRICHVSLEEMKKMEEKADVSEQIGVDTLLVMFDGRPRIARVVHALKEGVTVGS
jgi:hypothetical protein